MNKLDDYKARAVGRHGQKCDFTNIDSADASVKSAYESGLRVKVQSYGEVLAGYIGLSTGWAPCFILVHNARSMCGNALSPRAVVLGPSNAKRPCKARR